MEGKPEWLKTLFTLDNQGIGVDVLVKSILGCVCMFLLIIIITILILGG